MLKKVCLLSLLFLTGCSTGVTVSEHVKKTAELQIAFMPDIHFHDVYAQFSDGDIKGAKNSITGKQATIRTMSDQLTSTRLFNENYFALLAALDDVAARGVKFVALPGDFSDDGQPVHVRGLKKILAQYQRDHGITFFISPGNHDPVQPHVKAANAKRYLLKDGKSQAVYSLGATSCDNAIKDSKNMSVCSNDAQHMGYQGLMTLMAKYGFMPQPEYDYWETPYSDYRYENYQFATALQQASLSNREYEICSQGTGGQYKQKKDDLCTLIPEASYLVEPSQGVWLLAIDANVFVPKLSSENSVEFNSSSNAGYNKLFQYKAHVIEWIRSVAIRAKKLDKTLIAFSHFPMHEFYDGAGEDIVELFGKNSFQLAREPKPNITKALAQLGIKLHIAGHMHFNDTGVYRGPNNQVLFNVQAPSLAAYVPAYKLITLHDQANIEVETVIIRDVPRFDELFEHYQQEYKYLSEHGMKPSWDVNILKAKNYHEFTNGHLRELSKQRFIPEEWPLELKNNLFSFNGMELLTLAYISSYELVGFSSSENLNNFKVSLQWRTAYQQALNTLEKNSLIEEQFSQWQGEDLAVDFYRLRNAGDLAFEDISKLRMQQYALLKNEYDKSALSQNNSSTHGFKQQMATMLSIFEQFSGGKPSRNFRLNLAEGSITQLN